MMNDMDYEKKKIEKLDPAFMGSNAGSAGASLDEVVLKINEIIDVLNGEEPELRESEGERIRKVIYKLMLGMREEIFTSQDEIVTKEKVLALKRETPRTNRICLQV